MSNHNIGELIKKLRKQKGISQEELAGELMDRAHISRIESGVVTPSKKTTETLLERLGFNPEQYLAFYLNREMTESQKIMDELDSHLENQRVSEADALIVKLDADEGFKEGLNLQYLLIAKAANAIIKGDDIEKIKGVLSEAIKITIPYFAEQYIEEYYLSIQDLRIINMMAIVYFNSKELDKAIEMMYRLKNNFDKNCIDKTHKGKHYPLLICNLANYLYRAGRYREAIELCDIGSRVCLDTGFLFFMPLILMHKVRCLHKLGDIETCKRLIKQAYYCFDMFEMYPERGNAKIYADKQFGVDL